MRSDSRYETKSGTSRKSASGSDRNSPNRNIIRKPAAIVPSEAASPTSPKRIGAEQAGMFKQNDRNSRIGFGDKSQRRGTRTTRRTRNRSEESQGAKEEISEWRKRWSPKQERRRKNTK